MIRHISIFTLKNKEEINNYIELLQNIGKECKLIAHSEVGINITKDVEVKGPDFGDVIQIIDFNTKADLDSYPTSKEHMYLFNHGPKMIKVTAIDYEIK